jgi:hypothetical protein
VRRHCSTDLFTVQRQRLLPGGALGSPSAKRSLVDAARMPLASALMISDPGSVPRTNRSAGCLWHLLTSLTGFCGGPGGAHVTARGRCCVNRPFAAPLPDCTGAV